MTPSPDPLIDRLNVMYDRAISSGRDRDALAIAIARDAVGTTAILYTILSALDEWVRKYVDHDTLPDVARGELEIILVAAGGQL